MLTQTPDSQARAASTTITHRKSPMPEPDWQEDVRRWRQLPSEEQLRISLRRIPRKVARSMAFEGEPVDERMLEAELERILASRDVPIRLQPRGAERSSPHVAEQDKPLRHKATTASDQGQSDV
jgi:hypothetical protein